LNVVEFLKERFGANSVEVAHEYLRDAHEILLAGPREESGNKILELVDMALGVFSSSYVCWTERPSSEERRT
jgi:hypothetical protein